MLQDTFGRRFEYLRLSITDVCNFRCNYCLPDGYDCQGDRDFLNFNEFETLVQAFARLGMKKIRITGGEPALRKDLTDIIRLCKQTSGIENVAITTNGYNLVKHAQDWADAGLDALNVSVDSLDPRMFNLITGHNKLQKVLDGLSLAQQVGIERIKLNAVLMKGFNLSQFDQYLDWIKSQSLTVRFIELMETGDNRAFFSEQHVSGESIKQRLLSEGWSEVIRGKLAGPAQEFFHPDYQGRVGLIMPYSKDFCANCNRLRMSSTGKLHLCLFAEQGVDIRPMLADGDINGTCEALQMAMHSKVSGHGLAEHATGSTSHLAMLGG